jgi:hypothetical protein
MTQVQEAVTVADAAAEWTTSTRPSFGDRVLAEQIAEFDAEATPHLADLPAVLVLAVSAHSTAIETGAPPARELARLREFGARWATARGPLDPLLTALRKVTESVVRAAVAEQHHFGDPTALVGRIRATGASFVRELLTGFQQAYEPDSDPSLDNPTPLDRQLLASSLLWSVEIPDSLRAKAAHSYAVIAVHRHGPAGDDLATALDEAFAECGVRDTLFMITENDGYVLVPAHDEHHAINLCNRAHRRLGGRTWFAVSWRSRQEVGAGRQEAHAVLALVRGDREPGVYQLLDVLVEYAVMQDPLAMGHLISVITPVLRQEVLRTTLEAFIAANGNRSKAAGALKIHRSTLDYRLSRIEQLTGHQPTSSRGVQILATALATYEMLQGETEPAC